MSSAMSGKKWGKTMKTHAFLFLALVSCAYAQNASVIQGRPQPLGLAENPLRAEYSAMRLERSLLSSSPNLVLTGEIPLSEVKTPDQPSPHANERPLGDVARDWRKHEAEVARSSQKVK